MIDRTSRNQLAELIRSLATGDITNDQFEDALPVSEDRAIDEVYSNGAWRLYSDLHEHKLKDKYALTKEDIHLISRWILFLKSNYEYEWPVITTREKLLSLFTCGIWRKRMQAKWGETGDINYWPFVNEAQFEAAKHEKGYLGFGNS